jgi:tetratricopeptide (TPR) repeat protein
MSISSRIHPAEGAVVPLSSDPANFAHYGVKYCYIEEFVGLIGGRETIVGLSTSKVCELLRPLTATTQLSICQQLFVESRLDAVGPKADWFISHAWKYNFLEVLEAVELFLIKTYGSRDVIGDKVIWFDLFSNSQHNKATYPYTWWREVFASAVGDIGNVCMVMQPWNEPFSLTRAWCVFEVYACVSTNSRFEVAMTQAQKDNFLETMVETRGDCFYDMLGKVNSETSGGRPDDCEKIHRTIREQVPDGFIGLDSMIFRVMEKWMNNVIQETIDAARNAGNTLEEVKYELLLSILLRKQTTAGVAANVNRARRCVEIRESLLPTDDLLIIEARLHLSGLLSDNRLFEEAEILLDQCVQVLRVKRGKGHPETLKAVNMLASTYCKDLKFDHAERLLRQCLQLSQHVVEPLSDKVSSEAGLTVLSYEHNLANLYGDQGRFAEAKEMYLKVLSKYSEILGQEHHDTLIVKNNLAVLYSTMEEYADAEILLVSCLKGRERTLGKTHADTLIVMFNLSCLYNSLTRYSEAEMLCTDVCKYRVQSLGRKHPDTVNSSLHLAAIFRNSRRWKDSEAEIMRCMEGQCEFAVVAPAINELASDMDSVGLYDDAERLLQLCLSRIDPAAAGNWEIETLRLLCVHYSSQINPHYALAVQHIRSAVAISDRAFGPQHDTTIRLKLMLASTVNNLGQSVEAQADLLQCLDWKRQQLGDTHPETIGVVNMLESFASQYISRYDYTSAEKALQTCLNLKKQMIGKNHPSYTVSVEMLCTVAAACGTSGDKINAERIYMQAIKELTNLLGAQHRVTLNAVQQLGELYVFTLWKEKYEYAVDLMLECLHARGHLIQEMRGREVGHEDRLLALHTVAQLYHMLDKQDKAEPYFASCLESKQEILASCACHPDIISTMEGLARAQHCLGEFESADKHYSKALKLRDEYKNMVGQKNDSADELNCLYLLGELCRDRGQYKRAKTYWEDCLHRRRMLIPDEADTREVAESLEELNKLLSRGGCCTIS